LTVELSFEPFLGKFVTIIQYQKNNFVECLNSHFVFVGYFTNDQSLILTAIVT